MAYDIRPAREQEVDQIMRLILTSFHDDPTDPDLIEAEQGVYELDRSLVAVDSATDAVVGHCAALSRDLTVPGAVLPTAFVSMVVVAGTHRRRGIASALMHRLLADVQARGEAVALLWASEGRIYQRYGYGLAARRAGYDIDAREVTLRTGVDAAGTLRTAAPPDVRKELGVVYETVRAQRPGYASRDDRWWEHVLLDPKSRRDGATPRMAVLHYAAHGAPDGYALYRVRSSWDNAGPKGQVIVTEVVAANPAAYVQLWQYLLQVDLTRSVSYYLGAIDEPLQYLANEPRRLGTTVGDGLWLRIVDVAAALSARRYATPVNLVLEVTDHLLPGNSGRFRLTAPAGLATCTSVDAEPDVTLDAGTLGALYLGDASAGALAAAGRITEDRPGVVAELDAAFRWHRAPTGIEIF